MSPASHITDPAANKPGSCGKLVPNCTAKLVDPATGKAVGPNEEGELWVRGPNIMKEYLNNPEATAATIDADGYLHTGDIAKIDDEGFCFITDRLKELIKVKGFQVAPAELEGLLLEHEKIADAAVIGVPDERAGEAPKAFVVKKPDVELSAEDVMAFIAGKVADYKQIKYVQFRDAIPKSASGKILKRVLKEEEAKAREEGAGGAGGEA
uniref:4-coumarate--CoA ligase n=1 Tax=Bicosoecida sp. CB-2014 TaxID=1486930 RepID=A0A7S1G8A5_9STRA